jgi:secondary thiamine-phosphate synthase enzyme
MRRSLVTAARSVAGGHTAVMRTELLTIRTGSRPAVRDITEECAHFARGAGSDGLLHVFVPHATAGVAILETGAGSERDLLAALDDLLPADDRWRHRHGTAGHGRDHVMPALVPPYATIPVLDGRLALGTWQHICLVDLNVDNTTRQVRLCLLVDGSGSGG